MRFLCGILIHLQEQFKHSRKGSECGVWFIYTLPGACHPLPKSATITALL